MDVDKLGAFLEHQGFSDDEIDDYFEHHGTKGMKWGQRRAQRKAQRQTNRAHNARQRAKGSEHITESQHRRMAVGTTVAAGVGFLAARSRLMSGPASGIVGIAAAAGTHSLMRKHYDKKLSEISK